jgi:putative flippase GtrA
MNQRIKLLTELSKTKVGAGIFGLINDERFKFLLIGGLNTVFSTLLFIWFELWFGRFVPSFVPLTLSWVISLVSVFWVYRRFVFHVHGHVIGDLLRFALVNLSTLLINMGLLFIVSDFLGAPRIPAQLVITAATVLINYVGHKYFSFRRKTVSKRKG